MCGEKFPLANVYNFVGIIDWFHPNFYNFRGEFQNFLSLMAS